MEEEKKWCHGIYCVSCPRKLARDLIYAMAGIDGVTIYGRSHKHSPAEERVHYEATAEAQKLLEKVCDISFFLSGNVKFHISRILPEDDADVAED